MVEIAWRNLWRLLTQLRVAAHAQDLKDELREQLFSHCRTVEDIIRQPVTHSMGLGVANIAAEKVQTSGRRAFEAIDVEIDIFVASSEQPDKPVPVESSTTVNIYSPVGILQTGPNSNASIIQNLGSDDRRSLATALDSLHEALRASAGGWAQQQEMLEVTKAARAELDKPRPNGSLLSSLLVGIAASVQTIAALEPAYQALKAAAAAIGLTLP